MPYEWTHTLIRNLLTEQEGAFSSIETMVLHAASKGEAQWADGHPLTFATLNKEEKQAFQKLSSLGLVVADADGTIFLTAQGKTALGV